MGTIDEHGRPEPRPAVDEAGTLIDFLEWQRSTLEWKCRGLDAAGLRATTAKSSMTLAGLLKHMCFVEDHWFSYYLFAADRTPPWDTVDWTASPDWEWDTARTDDPELLWSLWRDSVDRSRACVERALARGGLDQLADRRWQPSDEAPSLRWIFVHMIEEYARHNGHADLLREAVDGETGE